MEIKKAGAIIGLTILAASVSFRAELNIPQIISTTIFSIFIFSTLLFWRFRLAFAFLGIVGLLVTGVLNIENLILFANFDIILFLVGMMTIIGFLERRHFFEYIISKVLEIIGPRPYVIVAAMMFMAGLFAAFVDEITSILFMTSMMLHLIDRYKVNPIPFVLMIVFATNIGSSATVIGNPIGILIALKGGLTFTDFLRWATPISFIVLLVAIAISLVYFSRDIKELSNSLASEKDFQTIAVEGEDIRLCWTFIVLTMPILIFHSSIEHALALEKNTMLLGASFLSAGLALLIEGKDAKNLLETRVDWWTLTFFALLFASVGTLSYVGTMDIVGNKLIQLSGGTDLGILLVFTGATAFLTPILDNVLVVAVFTPIVGTLSAQGFYEFPVWWGMLFGGTLFGNLTMIGSTANIVAVGMLESRSSRKMDLMQWIKPGIVISVPTLVIAFLLIYLQIPYMPR